MQKVVPSSVVMVTLVSVIFAPFAFAADFTSTNFTAKDPNTNDVGGTSTSTNFTHVSGGGEISNEAASSANFTLNGGEMFFESFTPKTQNWRWYDDENSVTPSTALAAENTAPTNIANLNTIKLRVSVAETAGVGSGNIKFRLQYATSSDFSEYVRTLAADWECTGSSGWCYANGAGVDNVTITTKVLSDADACALQIGNGCGTHNEIGTTTSTFTHTASAITEYEFTLKQSGAVANTVYFFRLFDVVSSSTVPLNTGESYPSLVVEGAALSFSIDGLAASTATEGVTTDVETTSTSVPFGTLAIGTPTEAAHRLTVSANSVSGYKIYAFQRQGLLADSSEISPVTGTNESPLAWGTGCSGGAYGCYGYHAGEDVLENGSTRFAANDTYAQFTGSPKEVAFNSGPATEKTTDIVYKVEAHNEQGSGSYSTNIVYIVTPVF